MPRPSRFWLLRRYLSCLARWLTWACCFPGLGPAHYRLLSLIELREEKVMLILTRRCAESLIIGDGEITVTVLGVKGNRCALV